MEETINMEKIIKVGEEIIKILTSKLNTMGERDIVLLHVSNFLMAINVEQYLEAKNKIKK